MIDLTISGGEPPYTSARTGPNGFNDIMVSLEEVVLVDGLDPGTYSVVVTDDLNCTDSLSFDIEEPVGLNVTIDNVTNNSCYSLDFDDGNRFFPFSLIILILFKYFILYPLV